MKFDQRDYDIVHLGVSGGKDSTAAMLWLLFESGIPRDKIRLSFCDTGNEDVLTYAYLDMLREKFYPIHTIYPERDFWELAKWKKRFPSTRARFCTQHLKIIPTRDYIASLMADGAEVVTLSGTRRDEAHTGNERGTQPQFEQITGIGCATYRPIIEWSIDDVWNTLARYIDLSDVVALVENDKNLSDIHKGDIVGRITIPRNPLYDMGASRVGCYPCVNSNKMEIRNIARYRPETIERIARAEQESGSCNRCGYSSFFAMGKIPLYHRTKKITTKSGDTMRVASIRDVVRWSRTIHGRPRQYDMDAADVGSFL